MADSANNAVRVIDPATLATSRLAGAVGVGTANNNGVGTNAGFNLGYAAAAVDASGVVYIADNNNHLIRAINSTSGAVATLAGGGAPSPAVGAGQGLQNGVGSAAQFNLPAGIACTTLPGVPTLVFVADSMNNVVRQVDVSTLTVTTLAGGGSAGNSSGAANGIGSAATFFVPWGLATDAAGANV